MPDTRADKRETHMHKDREMRNARGDLILLEKPGYGVMIKDGVIVNEEAYKLFRERQKQNAVAPTQTDPALAEQTKKQEEELLSGNKKVQELEEKVDKLTSALEKLVSKLDEK